jgi:hypothetical protein
VEARELLFRNSSPQHMISLVQQPLLSVQGTIVKLGLSRVVLDSSLMMKFAAFRVVLIVCGSCNILPS